MLSTTLNVLVDLNKHVYFNNIKTKKYVLGLSKYINT